MSDLITIRESCGCGATLVYSSSRNISGLDVSAAQEKFHKTHKSCRVSASVEVPSEPKTKTKASPMIQSTRLGGLDE